MTDQAYENRIVEYECLQSIKFARLGYLLANGKLDQEAASDIVYQCQPLTGWFPLISLDVAAVIDAAGDRWSNSEEEIAALAREACQRVWQKWDGNGGETASAAQDWALDLIEDYARSDGIELIEGEREG